MPGYAYPVGADQAAAGNPVSQSAEVTAANTNITIFTANSKTKITSILVYNSYGTILPVNIFKKVGSDHLPLNQVRVLKSRYALQSLVSGDTRVKTEILERNPITEVVLESGESISASCPIEDVVTVTVTGLGGL